MSGTIRVLHVDDDRDFLELSAAFLPRHAPNIQVTTAERVETALDHVSDVDCIISDYDMPETDGLNLLDIVRKQDHTLPFILCTGHGSEEVASDAISRKVTDYIQKAGVETFDLLADRIQTVVIEQQAVRFEVVTKQQPFTILERITDAFFALDDQYQFTYLNNTAEAEFGSSADDLFGQVIWEQFPEARQSTFFESYQTAFRTQEPQILESYFEPWDKWYREYVYPSPDGLSVFFRDITESKKTTIMAGYVNCQFCRRSRNLEPERHHPVSLSTVC